MTFDFPGYPLILIQRSRCHDVSDHEFTYVYKFFSDRTRYFYIVRAEYHKEDVFAIKFYCKKDRRSEFKYSKIVNKGDWGNIIMSCAKVLPMLLQIHPTASFCFAASRSVDLKNKTVEDPSRTQRFRIYCELIPFKFGEETFEHYAYDEISCYLLRNRRSDSSKEVIEDMFRHNYKYLHDFS